jgi:hypothetical protein
MICTFRNSPSGTPLIAQDITADRTIVVDIRMVDLGRKRDTRRFEWIVRWKHDGEKEDAAIIWCIALELCQYYQTSGDSVRRTGPIIVACQWKRLSPVGPPQ